MSKKNLLDFENISRKEAIKFLVETKHTLFIRNGKLINKLPKRLPAEEVLFIVEEIINDMKRVIR